MRHVLFYIHANITCLPYFVYRRHLMETIQNLYAHPIIFNMPANVNISMCHFIIEKALHHVTWQNKKYDLYGCHHRFIVPAIRSIMPTMYHFTYVDVETFAPHMLSLPSYMTCLAYIFVNRLTRPSIHVGQHKNLMRCPPYDTCRVYDIVVMYKGW